MVSMRILLWIWNNPLRMQIFKRNNTYFVILVNSRVERAVRGDEWKDFCGENCGLNLSLLHSFWRRIGVGRSNFLIWSLVKNLQENHSHRVSSCFLQLEARKTDDGFMPQKTEAVHILDSNLPRKPGEWSWSGQLQKQEHLELSELVRERAVFVNYLEGREDPGDRSRGYLSTVSKETAREWARKSTQKRPFLCPFLGLRAKCNLLKTLPPRVLAHPSTSHPGDRSMFTVGRL